MEYTKDIILHVNYGQEVKSVGRFRKTFYRLSSVIARHKIMSTVILITGMLMIVEIMLVSSFINILGSITF